MQVHIRNARYAFKTPFRIAYRVRTHVEALIVELVDEDGVSGRGEAVGVSYHGETLESIATQAHRVAPAIEEGAEREDIQHLLPAGGARNAIDCAYWDLAAKCAGLRIWELLGLGTPKPLLTAFTIGVDDPERMRAAAVAAAPYPILKLKLDGGPDIDRVRAVRDARPDATVILDANQAWEPTSFNDILAGLLPFRIALIEQPFAVGKDESLGGFASPIPLCADESCQTTESLPGLLGKYQYVNIKLDKTGGLTEALRLAGAARDRGFGLMIGCMAGSSLSMAPAFIIGQQCSYVDLNGPLLSAEDVAPPIDYDGAMMSPPPAVLWG